MLNQTLHYESSTIHTLQCRHNILYISSCTAHSSRRIHIDHSIKSAQVVCKSEQISSTAPTVNSPLNDGFNSPPFSTEWPYYLHILYATAFCHDGFLCQFSYNKELCQYNLQVQYSQFKIIPMIQTVKYQYTIFWYNDKVLQIKIKHNLLENKKCRDVSVSLVFVLPVCLFIHSHFSKLQGRMSFYCSLS